MSQSDKDRIGQMTVLPVLEGQEFDTYELGIAGMLRMLKNETNARSQLNIEREILGYLDRAMAVKEQMKDQSAFAESVVLKEKPDVSWDQVAGLQKAKSDLSKTFVLSTSRWKRKSWRSVLLYGPPGTGKSHLAKAVATATESTFLSVSSADLVSKWNGKTEEHVRKLFNVARKSAPAVIFIDEIDSLCMRHGDGAVDGETSALLQAELMHQLHQIQANQEGVLVLGATSMPWSLSSYVLERFAKKIYIPLPDEAARAKLFKLNVGNAPNSLKEKDYQDLGKLSAGLSGSDIAVVVREALMLPLREIQSAEFFRMDAQGFYVPVFNCSPPCRRCAEVSRGKACRKCGAIEMGLFDVDPAKLKEPVMTRAHVYRALETGKATVSSAELAKFEAWAGK